MRFFFELIVCLVIFSLTVLAGALFLWIVGVPLEFNFRQSIGLSAAGVGFVIPGAWNILIAVRNTDSESTGKRFCALMNGVGMLVGALAFIFLFVVPGAGIKQCIWMFLAGAALWIGSMIAGDHVK